MSHRYRSCFPRRSLRWALPVAMTAAATLAGCGASAAAPTTTLTTVATTTTTLGVATTTTLLPPPTNGAVPPIATTVAPPTTTAPAQACLTAQLTVLAGPTQGAAGHLSRRYQLQNSSSTPCTLLGYPSLILFDSTSKMLPTSLVHQSGSAPAKVVLGPGGSAFFSALWSDATGYPGATCPTSSSIEITPPNATTDLVVIGAGGSIQAFGGSVAKLQCGTITVTPVSASSAA